MFAGVFHAHFWAFTLRFTLYSTLYRLKTSKKQTKKPLGNTRGALCFPFPYNIDFAGVNSVGDAQKMVRDTGNLPVPLHLRNSPTQLMKELDYGKEYKYSHDYPNNFVEQPFMPDALINKKVWNAQNNPQEARLKERMDFLWKKK